MKRNRKEERDRSHALTMKWGAMGLGSNLYHGGVCKLGKLYRRDSCAIVLFCTEASDFTPTLTLEFLGLHVESLL